MTYAEWQAKRNRLADLLECFQHGMGGCANAVCKLTGPRKGMHTNASCRCMKTMSEIALEVAEITEQLGKEPWRTV